MGVVTCCFLERICDTKAALGKLPDVTWKKDGRRRQGKVTNKRWLK